MTYPQNVKEMVTCLLYPSYRKSFIPDFSLSLGFMRKQFVIVALFFALTHGSPARADDYEIGQTHYSKGQHQEAFRAFMKGANKGDPKSRYNLGIAYSTGEGVKKNEKKAFAWYKKAATQGLMYAQYSLANCYEEGLGTRQDYTQAGAWHMKAALQGHPMAQYSVGVLFEEGKGDIQDFAEAARWYAKAA
jgi:TPR repeat protein